MKIESLEQAHEVLREVMNYLKEKGYHMVCVMGNGEGAVDVFIAGRMKDLIISLVGSMMKDKDFETLINDSSEISKDPITRKLWEVSEMITKTKKEN